jgi:hypothetical protein
MQLLSAPANPGDAVIGLALQAIAGQWAHQTAKGRVRQLPLELGDAQLPVLVGRQCAELAAAALNTLCSKED